MKKSTIGKFTIIASTMVPEGCIFFCHPDDEHELVSAIRLIEKMPMDAKQRKDVQAFLLKELTSQLKTVKS